MKNLNRAELARTAPAACSAGVSPPEFFCQRFRDRAGTVLELEVRTPVPRVF